MRDTTTMTGADLRAIRDGIGASNRELADRLGMSRNTINDYANQTDAVLPRRVALALLAIEEGMDGGAAATPSLERIMAQVRRHLAASGDPAQTGIDLVRAITALPIRDAAPSEQEPA